MLFSHLPDESDCWIYASDRALSAEQIDLLTSLFNKFSLDWSSHGRKVHAGFDVVDARIMIVSAHIAGGDISGCGTDKSLHLLQEVAENRSFSCVSALHIVYRSDEGEIEVVSRKGFRELAETGQVHSETPVVDLSIRRLGELRARGMEIPASSSWHGQVFTLKPQAETVSE